ncbi:N-acetyl-gamma-glutamyl-phosphate reductase [Chondrinema litorale]|uniref:N-acetyl-gamma-glutamyl-phosphate reductase n=1 Tax=Chondrinema litorale TaxID=2994555 RepID=UPI002543409E|nr:N-acetyl-gamma-glutamyl-phosphate reductase [Chondrinema litorale]UZR94040.1 N-acetyl-gamma-glutamyl-phosphate reductase [Chondrinema litorale]
MIRAGIVGGAGYTAGELLRILINHPEVEISFIHSKSHAGQPVSDVHTDLLGDTDLIFSDDISVRIDVMFLCMGHGQSEAFLKENPVPGKMKIIDLSQDFRIKSMDHDFIYGLPELNRHYIKAAERIANPGCFATCIQLGLLPLAGYGLIQEDVHIQGITGSTGAGQKPMATTHFSWRNNNVSVYKAFKHQHIAEITQSIKQLQPKFDSELLFVPVRGNFTRGILCSMYTKCTISFEEIKSIYESYYKRNPFIVISEKNPDLKQVVNTNKGIVYLEKHGDYIMIITAIDNLLRGASGQAVQNMNIAFGLDDTTGLKLKAAAF